MTEISVPTYVTAFSWIALCVVFLTGSSVLFLLALELYWKVFNEILKLLKMKKNFAEYIWYRKEFRGWLKDGKIGSDRDDPT